MIAAVTRPAEKRMQPKDVVERVFTDIGQLRNTPLLR
jgi:hypothetical protein